MPYKVIQIGSGGFGAAWCSDFLPPNIKDNLVEVVAAVDINPEALRNARKYLGLSAAQCYTDIKKAFDENPDDWLMTEEQIMQQQQKAELQQRMMTEQEQAMNQPEETQGGAPTVVPQRETAPSQSQMMNGSMLQT